MRKFWMILRIDGNGNSSTSHKHETKESAIEECKRIIAEVHGNRTHSLAIQVTIYELLRSYSEATEDKMPESSKKDASPLNEICQGLGCSCTSPDAYAYPERCEIVRKFVRYMTKNQQDLDPEIAKLINKHFWELT